MEIKYDTPIEVTKAQYEQLMHHCAGIVCGRIADGKYFIKVWAMKYVALVKKIVE
jgi:hypothetical protein